jgi:hypothetical protein
MSGLFIPPKSANPSRFYNIDFLIDIMPANWPTLLRRSGRVCSGLFTQLLSLYCEDHKQYRVIQASRHNRSGILLFLLILPYNLKLENSEITFHLPSPGWGKGWGWGPGVKGMMLITINPDFLYLYPVKNKIL